ncbi:hypothetical protein WN51_04239 [Melipona quadrifasciata]|uniref:Uncharacterized protein n=1 Tax=Melipona quadrifasciata TaxID=166423 RepID=A0A0M8ZU60_9HYME|nr:hypothetical protein WN51_04239 [Melipona quadrifasciata]
MSNEVPSSRILFTLTTGGGGLEICGDGARPYLPLAIHGSLRAGHGVHYPASAESLRHHEADRHQVQQDREEEDDAVEHGSRGGLTNINHCNTAILPEGGNINVRTTNKQSIKFPSETLRLLISNKIIRDFDYDNRCSFKKNKFLSHDILISNVGITWVNALITIT